jgi:DNA-binding CsgD family transcriptional regulator
MGIAIAPDPRIAVWMALQRGPHKPPFADEERELAMRLGHHVEKSLRLGIRLFDAELTNLGLGGALLRLGIGVFALDSLGRVVFSNPAAKRLIGDQIHLVNGALRMGRGAQRSEIESAVARALKGEVAATADTKPILLQRVSDRPLVVYLLPIRLRAHDPDAFLTHTRAIVLVIDPRSDEPADPAVVRDVLGLTLGEARVAALVSTGLKLREAADKLGIAEETARSALKRVFSKVGVSRQSELSALLTKLVLR